MELDVEDTKSKKPKSWLVLFEILVLLMLFTDDGVDYLKMINRFSRFITYKIAQIPNLGVMPTRYLPWNR